MRRRCLLSVGLLSLFWSLLSHGASAQQTSAVARYRLNQIEVEGLRNVGKDRVVEVSALKLEQEVDTDLLKAAVNRLYDTGWFNRVTYRYEYSAGRMDLTFVVEEKVLAAGPIKLGR